MADFDYKAEAIIRAKKISYEYKAGTDEYGVTPLKPKNLIPAIITSLILIFMLVLAQRYIFPLYFP